MSSAAWSAGRDPERHRSPLKSPAPFFGGRRIASDLLSRITRGGIEVRVPLFGDRAAQGRAGHPVR